MDRPTALIFATSGCLYQPETVCRTLQSNFDCVFINSISELSNTLEKYKHSAEIIINLCGYPIVGELVEGLKKLKLIVVACPNDRQIIAPETLQGIQVIDLRRDTLADFAESALLLLLECYHRGSYNSRVLSRLRRKRVGFASMGATSEALARLLDSFNCEIIYTHSSVRDDLPYTFESNFDRLIEDVEILIVSDSSSLIDDSYATHLQCHYSHYPDVILDLSQDGSVVSHLLAIESADKRSQNSGKVAYFTTSTGTNDYKTERSCFDMPFSNVGSEETLRLLEMSLFTALQCSAQPTRLVNAA
ncbi:hypothetical protein [Polycladidibacter stylochi]|uniref:hypothetical protein n=1 Tax=Polycladidibacter stylochi TaxID=1807766 RepID=UPI0008341785|nr:hypothetical protein [Pseudovibrio stylochi]